MSGYGCPDSCWPGGLGASDGTTTISRLKMPPRVAAG